MIHRVRTARGSGTRLAMRAGVVKMPTPTVFETSSAMPSRFRYEIRKRAAIGRAMGVGLAATGSRRILAMGAHNCETSTAS